MSTFQKTTQIMKSKQFLNFFMIPNSEGWHYLVVKYLSALLGEITPKHSGDFCLLLFELSSFLENEKKEQT